MTIGILTQGFFLLLEDLFIKYLAQFRFDEISNPELAAFSNKKEKVRRLYQIVCGSGIAFCIIYEMIPITD